MADEVFFKTFRGKELSGNQKFTFKKALKLPYKDNTFLNINKCGHQCDKNNDAPENDDVGECSPPILKQETYLNTTTSKYFPNRSNKNGQIVQEQEKIIQQAQTVNINHLNDSSMDNKPKKFEFKKRPNVDMLFLFDNSKDQKESNNLVSPKVESPLIYNTIEQPKYVKRDFQEDTKEEDLNQLNNSFYNIEVKSSLRGDLKETDDIEATASITVSQTLDITEEDYMDDEEFERRFGNIDYINSKEPLSIPGNSKQECIVSEVIVIIK